MRASLRVAGEGATYLQFLAIALIPSVVSAIQSGVLRATALPTAGPGRGDDGPPRPSECSVSPLARCWTACRAPRSRWQPKPPVQIDDNAVTDEAGTGEASGDRAASPSPSPTTPSTTPSATTSPATTPNPTTPVSTAPAGAADGQPSESEATESNPTASTDSGWVWLLVAAGVLAIGGAIAVALTRRRPRLPRRGTPQ